MHKKTLTDYLIYLIIVYFLGIFGVHKFIDKKPKLGVLYLFTVGLFGVGWIIDSIKAFIDFIKALVKYIKSRNSEPIKTGVSKTHITTENKAKPSVYSVSSDLDTFLQKELFRIDAMSTDGFQFEHYCAELLLKNGFSKAEVTQGSGDFGVDIIAEKDNISYAVQCKCYSNPVGNKAVQEAYSGKEFYKCMVAAVLTNNTFTKAAEETAKQTRVLLWDRTHLSDMLSSVYYQNMKKPPVITKVTSDCK